MSLALVDDLFELRELIKSEDADQASRKLRQIIVETERNDEKQGTESDAHSEQVNKWLQSFLDNGYAVELARLDKNQINVQGLAQHVEERRKLLTDGLLVSPALSAIIRLCSTLGHACKAQNLNEGIAELQHHLRHHLIMDEELRQEVTNLGQSLTSSLTSMEQITGNMGDDSSDLNQARSILSKQLPKEPEAAMAHLRSAADALTSAEGKLGSAVTTITEQMKASVEEVDQLRDHLKQAQEEARRDPLTGLANRRELREYFDAMDDRPASLLVLDLDFFKKVNDTYGHDVGDEVLAEIAERLTKNTREGDIAARIGGEEFAAILMDVRVRQVFKVAEQIRESITATPVKTSAGEIPVTISIGTATRDKKESISNWKKRADIALYEAKEKGRNCTRVSI